MYARLVIFKLGPGEGATIRALAEEFDPLYRALPGFKELRVLADEARCEYGSFSVWESKDDAEAANAVIAPELQRALAGRLQGAPNRWFFEVVEALASS
jgi:heme-degrading monooxygenase HmoA